MSAAEKASYNNYNPMSRQVGSHIEPRAVAPQDLLQHERQHAEQPAVSAHAVGRLAETLREAIFARSKPGFSAERTLKQAFVNMDLDGSGEVDFQEFVNGVCYILLRTQSCLHATAALLIIPGFGAHARAALSRFGLQLSDGPNGRVQGGVKEELMWGLFHRWNADGSPTLSYIEFCEGLLKVRYDEHEEMPFSNLRLKSLNNPGGSRHKQVMVMPSNDRAPAGSAENAAACANPWLPTLCGQQSMDPRYSRPNSAKPAVRVLSLANPKSRLPAGSASHGASSGERVFG